MIKKSSMNHAVIVSEYSLIHGLICDTSVKHVS